MDLHIKEKLKSMYELSISIKNKHILPIAALDMVKEACNEINVIHRTILHTHKSDIDEIHKNMEYLNKATSITRKSSISHRCEKISTSLAALRQEKISEDKIQDKNKRHEELLRRHYGDDHTGINYRVVVLSNKNLQYDSFVEECKKTTIFAQLTRVFISSYGVTHIKIANIEQMKELFADTFHHSYEKLKINFSKDEIVQEFNKQIDMFKNDNSQRIAILVQSNMQVVQRIIGFVMYEIRHDYTYVAQVVVSRDWQCLGFGRRLMANIEQSKKVCGLVRSNNIYALDFYTRKMKVKKWPRDDWPDDLADRYSEEYIGLVMNVSSDEYDI